MFKDNTKYRKDENLHTVLFPCWCVIRVSVSRDLVGHIKIQGHAIFSFFSKGKLCADLDDQGGHYYNSKTAQF